MDENKFEALAAFSASLHGHKYVLPVAVWVLDSAESSLISQPEIRKGLVYAESNRIFEALERLVDIQAMTELPPAGTRRFFERRDSPYWDFAEQEARRLDAAQSAAREGPNP